MTFGRCDNCCMWPMLDCIRRFFGDFRPADLVASGLEFAFIVVILWLELPERFHHRTVRSCLRLVQARLADGQRLHESVPPVQSVDLAVAEAWIGDVKEWTERTDRLLSKYSIAAGLSFRSRAVEPDVNFGNVSRMAEAYRSYAELLHRLRNLQNIMEKADVYF